MRDAFDPSAIQAQSNSKSMAKGMIIALGAIAIGVLVYHLYQQHRSNQPKDSLGR
jgi:uncharacterized membrane protein YebE (DUF533 family)